MHFFSSINIFAFNLYINLILKILLNPPSMLIFGDQPKLFNLSVEGFKYSIGDFK